MKQKCTLSITLLVLLLLIVPPVGISYREFSQAKLDHALIAAIKAGNDQKALEALAEGASGEARDMGEPPTFREALLHLWDHFRHPGRQGDDACLPALVLLYVEAIDKGDQKGDDMWGPGPNMTLVCALLDHGANINDKDPDGRSAFFNAACFSNREMLPFLLAKGATLDERDMDGCTPLAYATPENTEDLIRYGADINSVDKDGLTALMIAAIACHYNKTRVLLKHGAKVNVRDKDGNTALDWATRRARANAMPADPRIVALLRKYGAK